MTMKFICVIDKNNEIVTVGAFDKSQMQKAYPGHLVVFLTNISIPSDFTKECYQVTSSAGKYTLAAKNYEEILVVETAKEENRRKKRRQPSQESLKALTDLDASGESGSVKVIIQFLQDIYGGAINGN